jgi:hypothetical protein
MPIQTIVHAMVKDYLEKRAELVENYVFEYLKGNPDLSINDIELVEVRVGEYDMLWYCRPKGSDE